MFKISYTVNGRTVAPGRIADQLGKVAMRSATAMAQHQIASIHCPVHHRTARVSPGASASRFELQGCCERLMDEIRSQLR